MLLERIGIYSFSMIRPIFFYCILLAPVFFATSYFYIQYTNINDLEERFYSACKKGKSALERKTRKDLLMRRYANTSPYFLDEEIESLSFLSQEQKELEALIQHPALADKRPIDARLHFLLQGTNRLSFTEEAIRTSSTVKETEEKQRHPVQMSEEDLKRTLALIEDVSIESFSSPLKRPQCIITDFRLEQKQSQLKTNFFEVEMQFIKREFIP